MFYAMISFIEKIGSLFIASIPINVHMQKNDHTFLGIGHIPSGVNHFRLWVEKGEGQIVGPMRANTAHARFVTL